MGSTPPSWGQNLNGKQAEAEVMPSSSLVEIEIEIEIEIEVEVEVGVDVGVEVWVEVEATFTTFTGGWVVGWVVVQPSLVEVEAELGNTKLTLQKQKI